MEDGVGVPKYTRNLNGQSCFILNLPRSSSTDETIGNGLPTIVVRMRAVTIPNIETAVQS